MSAITTTIKSAADVDALIPDGMAAAIVDAFGVKTITYRKRADVVRRLANTGLSAKGIYAALTVKFGADMPDGLTSDTVISRWSLVNGAMADETFLAIVKVAKERAGDDKAARADAVADVDGIIADLFRLTGGAGGGKSTVTAALATLTAGDDIMTASLKVRDAVSALSAGRRAGALARKNTRGPGEPGGKTPAGEITDGDTSDREPVAPAAPSTLPGRIDALTRELSAMTADDLAPVLADALMALIATAETLVGVDALADILAD